MSLTPTGRPADRTQAGAAYARIEEMIVTLELAPGEVVTETRLRELTGMGRTPVREALLQLKQDFLLSVMPREGILIRPIEVSVALDALEVRGRIEGLLIEHAVRKATSAERERFAGMALRTEAVIAAGDSAGFSKIDQAFNAAVAAAARHEVAARAVMPLHAVSRRIGYFLARFGHVNLEETALPHARIMQAIADSDPREALAALDTLLIRTREQTLGIERSGLLDEGMPPVDPAKERTSTG
ncbi:MAG: GntR family transcriptional regulator [Rhodobacteraceae bacterium]|jgi:DNA-binding GntR family transcriptional regulator|uniref:Transcriptional regulator n=1 Tax=Salipiger profundus TaxID=1229727 RepID=A0A1U7D8U9_9RHOB|nr:MULTISPECIES: GntR family transcriptional regulator [Salipiger]APX24485.1 transcriptional regulator [Salipiger profundus]MAB07215.1 GntR family transcriptional regulator [Paracoccaceae bacterium]GGA18831.1 GntR family transcriptional regulator [Salipiger profundus]SFD40049.1 transcriptional regulator, GntR family [Salipiger profundus]